MAAPISHWKLGLFVVLVAGALVAALVTIGESSEHHPSVAFHTYFDESVEGLDNGARVSFRGVGVGAVERVSIAADHRHIDVEYDLYVDALAAMGFVGARQDHGTVWAVPPALRAEIGGSAITGVKNVSLDVVEPPTRPPVALPFAAASNTIPAALGGLQSIEKSLAKAADEVPALAAALKGTASRADRLLARLERDHVDDKAVETLARADETLAALARTIGRFDRAAVPEKASATLDALRGSVAKLDRVLDQLDGERGLVANVNRTTAALGEVGRGMSGSTRDLDQVLDELRDAAAAIRTLAEDLDRQPDMLLKGRAKSE